MDEGGGGIVNGTDAPAWPEGVYNPFPEARERAQAVAFDLVRGFLLRGMDLLEAAYSIHHQTHEGWRDPARAAELWRWMRANKGKHEDGVEIYDSGGGYYYWWGHPAGYLSVNRLGGCYLVHYGLPRDLGERHLESLFAWREARAWESRAPRPIAHPEPVEGSFEQLGLFGLEVPA